jgi:DNA-directed RNA polymerase subunit RPC12/RpoP
MAASPPYLHPFVCLGCRRAFRRPGTDRNEAPCPGCGYRAIRKFKRPRRSDDGQWAKVEALVKLGFRFDPDYDADGAIIRYPSNEREIPAFVKEVAQVSSEQIDKAARANAAVALRCRQRRAARAVRMKTG